MLSTLFFFLKSTYTKATVLLGSFYFILSFYALHAFVIDGGHLVRYPGFFLWPLIPFNLIFVPIYFYFVTIFDENFKWKKVYFLLFLPFLLSLVDVSYIYTQPKEVYAQLFQQAATDPINRLKANYLLLSLNEHLLLRHIWQLIAQLVLLPHLIAFVKEGNGKESKRTLNNWLLFLWMILMLMAIIAISYALEKMLGTSIFNNLLGLKNGGTLVTLILYLIVFLMGVIPIYFPSILHGYPRTFKFSLSIGKIDETKRNDKFGLDEARVSQKLQRLVQKNRHLQQDFNITNCAREMEMPAHHLSYYIKQNYNLGFPAYKNRLRIDHAKSMIVNGYLDCSTIEALAIECGFPDRSSFSKVFKSFTKLSPSEFAHKLKKNS